MPAALVVEEGLAAVRAWEDEHGELTADELAWGDRLLGRLGSSTRKPWWQLPVSRPLPDGLDDIAVATTRTCIGSV